MTDSSTHLSTPPRHKGISPQRPNDEGQYPPHNLHQHHQPPVFNSHHNPSIAVQTSPGLKPARKLTSEGTTITWADKSQRANDDSDAHIVRGRRKTTSGRLSSQQRQQQHHSRQQHMTRPAKGHNVHVRRSSNRETAAELSQRSNASGGRGGTKVSAASQKLAARSLMSGSSSTGVRGGKQSSRHTVGSDEFGDEISDDDHRGNSSRRALSVGSPGLNAWDAIREDYDGDSIYGKELFDLVDELEDRSSCLRGDLFDDFDLLDGI